MPPKSDKLAEAVEYLRSQGYTQEKIQEFLEALNQKAYQTMYSEAMNKFTPDDLNQIEKAPSQEEANQIINKLFIERIGKDPRQEVKNFLDKFAEEFLSKRDYEDLIIG